MKYIVPDFNVELFQLNANIADGCDRVVTGTQTTTTYPPQTVICDIGGQEETVFNSGVSGCDTAATTWLVADYQGTTYFLWYTYAGDTGTGGNVDNSMVTLMNTILTAKGQTAGPGWHFCDVTSETQIENILGFSY